MSQTKIYVGNLSYNVDNAMLREHFGQCGEVTDAKVITDRDTGRSKGFGFITFSDKSGMNAALKLNGTSLDERVLKVSQAEDTGGSRGGGGNRPHRSGHGSGYSRF